jgi:hypothetical protein
MLDETILTETPPLYGCYGRRGQQVRVPISGKRGRRILHGAINVKTGHVVLSVTKQWKQGESQDFLRLLRRHWRGWNIILFQDRAGQHTAPKTKRLAKELGIEIRELPRATPELNAMDDLWRHTKRETQANRMKLETIEESTQHACDYIYQLTPQERLRLAGILSGDFWLTKGL